MMAARFFRTFVAASNVAVFTVIALFFGATPVHGQASGGDIFNVNPGGSPGAPPSPPPGGDQFGTHTTCRATGWFLSPDGTEKWRYIILPADQAQRFQSLISTPDGQVRIRGCTDWCSATTKLCLVLQATPPRPIPPMRNPQQPATDCAGLAAQARATAAAIEGGSTSPSVMEGLNNVIRQCPPAFKRPIECHDMMVDAQSKVRTNPDYAKRRAQEAVDCYEGKSPQTPTRKAESLPPQQPTTRQACSTPECQCGAQTGENRRTGFIRAHYLDQAGEYQLYAQLEAIESNVILVQAIPALPPGVIGFLIKHVLLSKTPSPFKDAMCEAAILKYAPDILDWALPLYNKTIVRINRMQKRRGFRADDPEYKQLIDSNILYADIIKALRWKYAKIQQKPEWKDLYPPVTTLNFPPWAYN
jgi:hypothetical protein